jgi:hypothetical protein
MFDPENVEQLSKEEIASANPDDVYVTASAYNQLLAFYKAVPHSAGHIDCPRCYATREAILAEPIPRRTRRRKADTPLKDLAVPENSAHSGTALKLEKKLELVKK